MTDIATTPVALVAGPVLIQNLGPDDLYVGASDMNNFPLVTVEEGVKIGTGEWISFDRTTSKISVVSTGTSDIRYLASPARQG